MRLVYIDGRYINAELVVTVEAVPVPEPAKETIVRMVGGSVVRFVDRTAEQVVDSLTWSSA